jgi:hypothetical protein
LRPGFVGRAHVLFARSARSSCPDHKILRAWELELKRSYSEDFRARQAARMRLPVWLRISMPLMAISSIVAVTAASVGLFWALHRMLHPGISFSAIPDAVFILIFFPSFFGAMAPALMLLNLALIRIPPLKQLFDKNSEGVPGASYKSSMSGLRKVAIIMLPPALALSLLGAIEPWAF